MPFQMSPGVMTVEKDLTAVVPAVSTSVGAFVGPFQWGPVSSPTTITSEEQLVSIFGKPKKGNEEGTQSQPAFWFSAANFLSYSNNLLVVRANTDSHRNATSSGDSALIKSEEHFFDRSWYSTSLDDVIWAAKFPGALGNSLKVVMADSASFSNWTETVDGATVDYALQFDGAPGTSDFAKTLNCSNDELHVMVIDEDGAWTGVRGSILEKFTYLSKAANARRADGTANFYADVISSSSKYIWFVGHPVVSGTGLAWGAQAAVGSFKTLSAASNLSLSGGVDDLEVDEGDMQEGYDLLANGELYDISLVITGAASSSEARYAVQNLAEKRRDCVAFVSPSETGSRTPIITGDIKTKTLAYRNTDLNVNSSYGVIDSGWKYQYDRYNDVYRWVPLNGDIAGTCARTDSTTEPWYSPGGFSRGQIKNVVRLSFNPTQADRDELYKKGVNPVVSFPGQGVVLFGDKTLLQKPSAFDRINVRRLFIALEKAIAIAARSQLFEINDAFTQAQFKSMVEPFLRDVQGRRGITDFRVVSDETVNTGEVIDRNEFVANIFIKPARSINFITLNFVAARTSVSFDEIAGA
jgi:hypothetical protein